MFYANEIKRIKQVRRELKAQRNTMRLMQEQGIMSVTLATTSSSITVLPVREALNPFFSEFDLALAAKSKALKEGIRSLRQEWEHSKQQAQEKKAAMNSNAGRALRGLPPINELA